MPRQKHEGVLRPQDPRHPRRHPPEAGRARQERKEHPARAQPPLSRRPRLEPQGQELSVHAVPLRLRRRAVFLPPQRRAVQHDDDLFLHGRDRVGPRVPPLPLHRVQGSEAGEPAARQGRPPQDHRLRVRQEDQRQDLDAVRHPGVSRPGDHSVKGQMGVPFPLGGEKFPCLVFFLRRNHFRIGQRRNGKLQRVNSF